MSQKNDSVETAIAKQSLGLAMQVVLNFINFTFLYFEDKWNKHPHFGSLKMRLLITNPEATKRINQIVCTAVVNGAWDESCTSHEDRAKAVCAELESVICGDLQTLMSGLSSEEKQSIIRDLDRKTLNFLGGALMTFFVIYSGFLGPLSKHFAVLLTSAAGKGEVNLGSISKLEGEGCLRYIALVSRDQREMSEEKVATALINMTSTFLLGKGVDPLKHASDVVMSVMCAIREVEGKVVASSSGS